MIMEEKEHIKESWGRILITCFALLLIVSLGYLSHNRNHKPEDTKVYSLVSGEVNGMGTYFLISVDSSNIGTKPFVVTMDRASVLRIDSSNRYEGCSISLNGLPLEYDKRIRNIQPLIKDIKKSTGYEISGIIGNNENVVDTLP